MKLHRWWLPTASLFCVGVLLAAYPLLQHLLQSTTNSQPKSRAQTLAVTQSEKPPQTVLKKSPAEQLQAQVAPAVVTVYGANGLGSGMILRSQGLVLTNKHIVDNFATVKLKLMDNTLYDGTVVDFDLQYDLALIQIQQPDLTLPTVTLATTAPLQAGDRVYAIGSPGGRAGTLTTGTFTRITQHGSLQTSTGLLNPGNSGGPLLNAQGAVVGINKGLLNDNSGLATPVAAVQTLLQRYDRIHQPDKQ